VSVSVSYKKYKSIHVLSDIRVVSVLYRLKLMISHDKIEFRLDDSVKLIYIPIFEGS